MLTKEEFNAILGEGKTLVIDGALATELETRGHDLKHVLWSAKVLKENPDSIRQVHLDYYLAGADVAITASYQASTLGLYDHFGMSDGEAIQLIKQSVTLAQQAREDAYAQGVKADGKLLVAGSVGPFGAYLADGSEYRGDYERSREHFQSFHRPRIQALIDAGVDLLAVETMPNLEEIEAVLHMLRDDFPGAVAWLSCTLKNARSTADGTPINVLMDVVNQHTDQLLAVGINCVPTGIAFEALQHMKAYGAELPLLCYPNSGEFWDPNTRTWSGAGSGGTYFAKTIQSWRTAGARLIGGCCRTGPEYIKLVAKAIA